MNPEMRAALAALIRQYLEQTAKAEAKGALGSGAKTAGKSAAKALPKGTKIPPIDMGTADARFWSPNAPVPYSGPTVGGTPRVTPVPPFSAGTVDARFWTPGANVPATVGPQTVMPYAPSVGGGVVPGMVTGDWMTPGAAATAIGAAMLLRQMGGDEQPTAADSQPQFLYPGPNGPTNVPQIPTTAVPAPAHVAAAPVATHPTQAVAPQTAPRMTVQPSPQLAMPAGVVGGQVPVPAVAPPKAGLSFGEKLGQPEVYGMLGQLAQAIAPGSFGANLGGFASNRAQGILTNQALQSLLQSNPTLGLSDAAAGTLGPQAVAALGQQALQYDVANDQNVTRAFEAESPEQRLMREYIIATARPQADRSFKAPVTINEKGQTTPGQEHLWLFDEQGNRVKWLGGQAGPQRAEPSADDLAGKRANQLRFNLEAARKEALTLTAMEFKEVMIADPNDPANFVVNPYAPPEALARFKENYIRAVQDRQDNQQLPDNLAVLGEVVRKRGTVLQQAKTPGPVAPRGSINDVR